MIGNRGESDGIESMVVDNCRVVLGFPILLMDVVRCRS